MDDVDRPRIDDDDAHHLRRVLRLRPGDPIVVCDGQGWWRQVPNDRPLDSGSKPQWEASAVWSIEVSTAIAKGERSDWLIQKATEVGVDRLTFIDCDRSVVRWGPERAAKQLQRARRIARSAAAQSRRAWLPTLAGPLPLAAVAARPGAMRAERGGGPLPSGARHVIIGPEGGWSPTEAALPLPTVGLGPQILRTETAGVVASTLLVLLRAQLVVPAS